MSYTSKKETPRIKKNDFEPIESLDSKLEHIEASETASLVPIIEEETTKPKVKLKNPSMASYFKDGMISSYGKLKSKLSKAYCSIRERTRKMYNIKYRSVFHLEAYKTLKAVILDWCLILPRRGDPQRRVYLSLL